MLVFTRKNDDEVIIGDPRNPICVVRVVDIRGDRVRLGFSADQNVEIHRREIADDIKANGRRTAVGVKQSA